jgi:aminoglycoside 6'-N-acetyltransferase
LRPTSHRDIELLAEWLADPEVYRWWGGRPLGRDEIAADYTGRRSPEVESFIVEVGGRPVGFLQYWHATERSGGLDMFLVPEARGRGLGPDAARATVDHLFSERRWEEVTADPLMDNDRAVRGWAKAGLTPDHVGRDEETGKPCLIMVVHPGESEARGALG